jgi:3-phenylpropionate/cinnamic acid dioxygenase small subunit
MPAATVPQEMRAVGGPSTLPVVDDADAIRSLIHSYAELLDAGDLDGVAALFEHATWRSSNRSEVLQGATQVREAYQGVILYDGSPRTRHVISNVTVVCNGSPVASARSYFTVLQATPGLDLQPILVGRYHDELERVDDGWRFTDRLILPDLVGDLSRHMRHAPAPGTP